MRKLLILVDGPVDTRLIQSIVAARWDVHISNSLLKARDSLQRFRFHVGLTILDTCIGGRIPAWIEHIIATHGKIKWVQVLPRECLKSPRVARLIIDRCYDYHSQPIDCQRLTAILGHAGGMAALAEWVGGTSRTRTEDTSQSSNLC